MSTGRLQGQRAAVATSTTVHMRGGGVIAVDVDDHRLRANDATAATTAAATAGGEVRVRPLPLQQHPALVPLPPPRYSEYARDAETPDWWTNGCVTEPVTTGADNGRNQSMQHQRLFQRLFVALVSGGDVATVSRMAASLVLDSSPYITLQFLFAYGWRILSRLPADFPNLDNVLSVFAKVIIRSRLRRDTLRVKVLLELARYKYACVGVREAFEALSGAADQEPYCSSVVYMLEVAKYATAGWRRAFARDPSSDVAAAHLRQAIDYCQRVLALQGHCTVAMQYLRELYECRDETHARYEAVLESFCDAHPDHPSAHRLWLEHYIEPAVYRVHAARDEEGVRTRILTHCVDLLALDPADSLAFKYVLAAYNSGAIRNEASVVEATKQYLHACPADVDVWASFSELLVNKMTDGTTTDALRLSVGSMERWLAAMFGESVTLHGLLAIVDRDVEELAEHADAPDFAAVRERVFYTVGYKAAVACCFMARRPFCRVYFESVLDAFRLAVRRGLGVAAAQLRTLSELNAAPREDWPSA